MKGILLVGKMGCGKTTVAQILEQEYGYTRYMMAGWLKNTIMSHYNLDYIDKQYTINNKSMRTILQEVGMKMREVDKDWHIDELLKVLPDENFVIDDVRFLNEVKVLSTCRDLEVVSLVNEKSARLDMLAKRDGYVPTIAELNDSSESEIGDIMADHIIINTYNIEDLNHDIHVLMENIGETND